LLNINVQEKILHLLYEKWIKDFAHYTEIEDVSLEGISKEAILANARYLADKGLIEKSRVARLMTKITIRGIEQVESERISLDLQKRLKILQILKEHFEKDPSRLLSREKLVNLTGFAKDEIMRNVWYLGEKGLVRVDWATGGHFSARITSVGIDALKRPSLLEHEQKVMSHAYSIFYVLENRLRMFLERKLREAYGGGMWEKVPADVKRYAERAKSKEKESTLSLFHYMLFKHLGNIIGKNWDIFQRTFHKTTGIIARLDELESIRHRIAHCRQLSNDELAKLRLFFNEIYSMITDKEV
jgi:hypothetical protein